MGYEFEWNAGKAESNLRKHGVSFDDASTVFADLQAMNMPDPLHSHGESRFIVLGKSRHGAVLVVSYTERGTRTRLISARPASRKERRQYGAH